MILPDVAPVMQCVLPYVATVTLWTISARNEASAAVRLGPGLQEDANLVLG